MQNNRFYDKYHDEIMDGDETCLELALGILNEKSMVKLSTEIQIKYKNFGFEHWQIRFTISMYSQPNPTSNREQPVILPNTTGYCALKVGAQVVLYLVTMSMQVN